MKNIFLPERKGIARIAIGAILVLMQLFSIIGNSLSNKSMILSNSVLNNMAYFISCYSFGICGAILLFFGIRAFLTRETVRFLLHKNEKKAHIVTKYIFISLLTLECIVEIDGFYVYSLLKIISLIILIVYFLFQQGRTPSRLFAASICLFGAIELYQMVTPQMLQNIIILWDDYTSYVITIIGTRLIIGFVYILLGYLLFSEKSPMSVIKVAAAIVFIFELLMPTVYSYIFSLGFTIDIDELVFPLTVFVYTNIIKISPHQT